MLGAPWSTWLALVAFASPWFLGVLWICWRTPPNRDELPLSMGELWRRRQ